MAREYSSGTLALITVAAARICVGVAMILVPRRFFKHASGTETLLMRTVGIPGWSRAQQLAAQATAGGHAGLSTSSAPRVNRSHGSPALRSPCQSGSSYRFRVTANKQPDVGVIYSWRIHSEGLVPQNYSGSIRHSDENGWLPPAPWTVVAGRASCQILVGGRRDSGPPGSMSVAPGRRYDS
jgi:hypothetical protein